MKKDKKTKIVISGGHAGTTALAIVQQIQKEKLPWEINWIGPLYSVEGKKEKTLESEYFNKGEIIFHRLVSGRIQRKFTIWTIPSLLKIPAGIVHALSILKSIKPNIILSLGGYSSFPVVLAGWMLKVPVLMHEQTCAAGRANRISSVLAKRILLSKNESRKYFPEKKCEIVGNPILTEYFLKLDSKTKTKQKTIFITGGSRGSSFINTTIAKILPVLLDNYYLIHQVGPFDYGKISTIRQKLAKSHKSKYSIFKSIDPHEMFKFYQEADLVVARAGANTVSELIALKKPSIFIPIPWSYLDEQQKNAEYAEKFGIASILNQDGLAPTKLLGEINRMVGEIEEIQKKVILKQSPDKNASQNVVKILKNHIL